MCKDNCIMRRSIAICGWPQVYLVLIFLQSILCGSFDFDSSVQVRDHLKIALSEKIAQQEYKQQRFHGDTEQTIRKSSNRLKRSIDLNNPDRLSLFFVFSGSGEAGQVHFRKSINFAKEIVRKVGVSKISVVDSEDSWKQLLYSTSEGVINALDSINCTGEEASVFSALTWVMTRRFHLSKHILADDSGHFLVFILTDGMPNMSETEKFLARYLRRHDVEIYFIVTGNAEKDSHANVVSPSCDENVFFLKNYARSAWLFTEITGGKVENNSCPDPGAINNGRREGDCCYVDDVLQFSCNEDFDLIGEDEIICLSSGLWSHIRPICKRNTHSAAEVLVASGAKLYCIGLKYKSEKDSLYNIARTSTEKPQVFVLKNYTSLLWPDDEDTVRTRGSARSVAEGLVASGAEIYCIGVKDKTKKDSLFKITTYSTQKPQIFVLKNYTSLSWPDDEVTREIDYSLCGRGPEEDHIPSGRIVGGAFAVEPWPWMAAIYFLPTGLSDPAHAELKCGGSIIAEHFIVTAAHCMYDRDLNVRNARQIIVKLGLLNMKVKTFLQEPEVIDLFIHPSYNPGDIYDYDIALLQLNTPIMFNEHVRSICLPPSELPKESKLYSPNEFVLATGWGHPVATLFGTQFKLTDHLKEVALPIQSAEVCKQSLLKYRLKPEIHYTGRMFCAGGGGNDTCQGDSGGPLMQYEFNKEGRRIWTQVGIVSWGIGCGLPNSYGFYSHISQLRSWIDRTMELGFEEEEEE